MVNSNIELGVEAALKPKSIAIIGVSSKTDKKEFVGGTAILNNLVHYGYEGIIYPIHPTSDAIMGCKCYKSIGEVPEKIDLAVLAVASEGVPELVTECGEARVKAVIVISSGFAEVATPEGIKLQNDIVTTAEKYEMKLIGPNNLGLINLLDKVAVSTSAGLWCDKMLPGSIAWVSQSGALTSALYARAMDEGIGLAYVVTLGNEADLDMSDFISYMLDDDRVDVVGAYIERIKDMTKFREVALKSKRLGKPIIVMKTGSSERGAAAAMAHTGSLVGSYKLNSAFFRQNGVLQVEGIDELYKTANLMRAWKAYGPVENVAVITSSGGAGGILADLCEPAGLNLPAFSKSVQEQIMKEIPEFGSAQNPVDVTAHILRSLDKILDVGKILDQTDEVDAVLFAFSSIPPESSLRLAEIICKYHEMSRKPVVMCWYSATYADKALDLMRQHGIPCFTDFESTVTAIKRQNEFRNNKLFDAPCQSDYKLNIDKNGAYSEAESKSVLRGAGISTTYEILSNGWDETLNAAKQIGYPVVIKIDSADILHKTEADVVRLNIRNDAELKTAYEQITKNAKINKPDARINGVLVQEMIGGGAEVFIGATYDAQFGPNIVYGLGGIYVEVFKDIAHRIAPISKEAAMEMIEQTKSAIILKGARGKTYDIQGLAEMISDVSQLVATMGDRLVELDLNPVIVTKDGVKAVDALLITK